MQYKVTKEPVGVSALRRNLRPPIGGVGDVLRVHLHAQRDCEDEDADGGEECGEECVKGEGANGERVGEDDNAAPQDVHEQRVDQLQRRRDVLRVRYPNVARYAAGEEGRKRSRGTRHFRVGVGGSPEGAARGG